MPVQEVYGPECSVMANGEASAVGAEGNIPGSLSIICFNRECWADIANEGAGIEPDFASKFRCRQPSAACENGPVTWLIILVIARNLGPVAIAGIDAQSPAAQ